MNDDIDDFIDFTPINNAFIDEQQHLDIDDVADKEFEELDAQLSSGKSFTLDFTDLIIDTIDTAIRGYEALDNVIALAYNLTPEEVNLLQEAQAAFMIASEKVQAACELIEKAKEQ